MKSRKHHSFWFWGYIYSININSRDFKVYRGILLYEYIEVSIFSFTMLFPPVLHNFLLKHYLFAHLSLIFWRKLCKTPVRHTLQPLCDLSATDNLHQSQRSQQGPRSVPARLQRSRRLIGDLVATKSVAARFLCLHKNLAATNLVADRSRQSRRPVPDQSPTDRRLILSESGRG